MDDNNNRSVKRDIETGVHIELSKEMRKKKKKRVLDVVSTWKFRYKHNISEK